MRVPFPLDEEPMLAVLLALSATPGPKTVLMSFDKRELAEVIQFVSEFTHRNFIMPARLPAKCTLLATAPIPADEVWSVFLAALDANNWAVYPVGSYWKLAEKKHVPTLLSDGQEAPASEQMVTKLFKLRYVEAEQMRNVLAQFTSRDSDLQIFPPDTLIVSGLGLNLRLLERLIEQLDQPGGSQEIRIVSVQHAPAQDLAQKLGEILQAQEKKPGKILADERTNKLIVIASEKSFAAVSDLLRQLDVPTGDSAVHVYTLENAKAEDLAATLQSLSGSKKTPAAGEVKITADKNTNSLVVIAGQADWRNLVKLIERLDIARRQVFVEAVIMEVNLEDDTDFGASLHGGALRSSDVGVLGSEQGGLSSLGGVSSLSSLSGFLAGIQGPPITVSGVSIPSFGIVLPARQSSSDVNVISTPHVVITDNTEGEITVGQNVPFQAAYAPSSSTTGTSTLVSSIGSLYAAIQRQNVELKLHIKPQINQGDWVRLEVDEQTEEIASVDKTLGPTNSKRSAKTTVVARDQETIVIGGLIQERTTRSVPKVPILGSLPTLGWLFRNESTKKQKTNLLLFLTPYIIRDQSDVRRIFERKMAEREEFVRRFYRDDSGQRRFIDYDHKPGPLSRVRRGVEEELSKVENGGTDARGERVIKSGQ